MGMWYDKKAYDLLKKCSDVKDLPEWNEYRKAANLTSVNLRFADLSNFYLQKAELQNVDLRGAVSIKKADFSLSNVENTKFLLFNYHRAIFLFIPEMTGVFSKDKTVDKEDKSSSSTYREKMIANGMPNLLMQALKK